MLSWCRNIWKKPNTLTRDYKIACRLQTTIKARMAVRQLMQPGVESTAERRTRAAVLCLWWLPLPNYDPWWSSTVSATALRDEVSTPFCAGIILNSSSRGHFALGLQKTIIFVVVINSVVINLINLKNIRCLGSKMLQKLWKLLILVPQKLWCF